jgi:hypothetical protein
MQHHIKHRKRLYMAFIDVSKAYDSIYRETLWKILADRGVGPIVLQLIKRMYIGGTVVRVGKSFSALPFNATRGVKQGCLLSPLLFNIALDAAFRTAIPNMQPCSEMEVDLTLLAYADDMALCAHTPQQLQHNIDTLTAALAAIGLRVNIKKTETMSTPAAASEGKHRSKAAQVKSTKRRAGDKPTTPMEVVQDEVDGSPICLYPMAAADEKLFSNAPTQIAAPQCKIHVPFETTGSKFTAATPPSFLPRSTKPSAPTHCGNGTWAP